MGENVLILPNHGNEPYLLGVSIALESGAERICLPDYYHGRYGEPNQSRILSEEFPQDLDRIYLSKNLGRLLKPLLRDVQDRRSYPSYIDSLYRPIFNGKPGIASIEKTLRDLLKSGIEANPLSDKNQSAVFSSDHFRMALNIGLPIHSFIEPTFYIFTALMSAVYSIPLSPDQSDQTEQFQPLADYWREVEKEFAGIFVSKINALSHLSLHLPQITYTPPLTKPISPLEPELKRNSILMIPSGTGYDRKKLLEVGLSLKKNYQITAFSSNIPSAKKVTPHIFADNRLVAVLSRGGWGTTWKCMVHSKPIGYIYTSYEEDPEIAHSIKTLDALKIGMNIDPSYTADNLQTVPKLIELGKNYRQLFTEEKVGESFVINDQDYSKNGIGYVAEQIKQRLV